MNFQHNLYINGGIDSHTFQKNVDFIYEKIVFWRKNLFLLPTGKSGKKYIDEITRLVNAWLSDSCLKDVAFKAIMIMPGSLLQKPAKNSKARVHVDALERRIQIWNSGTGLQISVGHRTMSDRNNGLSDSNRFLSDIVSERKKYKHIMYNYIVKKY